MNKQTNLCLLLAILISNLQLFDALSTISGLLQGWRCTKNIKKKEMNLKFKNAIIEQEMWFNQRLDHFRSTDQKVWKQRYFENWEFYKPGGPAFLMIGGEGPANHKWMKNGTWIQYAKKFRAVCFFLEHRFYGKSHPTNDLSVKNLVYLSSEQALQDLATFISHTKRKRDFNLTTWIAFGGSYPGSLAAWLRLKYPHLVQGSISTSGPLYAKANFFEYLNVVKETIVSISPGCFPRLHESLNQVKILAQQKSKWNKLTKLFKLCKPFNGNDKQNVANFFSMLIDPFANAVQYNKDNRAFEGISMISIDSLCEIMLNVSYGQTPLQRLVRVLNGDDNSTDCIVQSYNSIIMNLRKVTWSLNGNRQWLYQTCTEFGWYQTSEQPDHAFTNMFPLIFSIQMCQDIFGKKFNGKLLEKAISKTNVKYGGKHLRISNVVFVHGSYDPWHKMGIIKDLSDSATAIYIQGAAHCANMYPAKMDDSSQLIKARRKIGEKIAHWLQ